VPLLTLTAAKQQLNITGTTNDDELQAYVDAVTGVVERHTGELMSSQQVIDTLRLRRASSFALPRSPAADVSSLARHDGTQTWDVADLLIDEGSGVVTVAFGPPVDGLVDVAYTAGYGDPPGNYKLAARIIAQHLWRTQRGAMGAVRMGGEDVLSVPAGFALPYAALELLGGRAPSVA
jgi:hypothetical protein